MTAEPTVDESANSGAMAARENLVENNFDEIVAGYQAACKQGEADPVVFLVDCEDPIGSQIARAWEGDDTVDEAILDARHSDIPLEGDASVEGKVSTPDESSDHGARGDSEERTTILVRTFPFADSCEEVPGVFPYLADSFRQAPSADQFLIVVVAAEGAATFTAPVP